MARSNILLAQASAASNAANQWKDTGDDGYYTPAGGDECRLNGYTVSQATALFPADGGTLTGFNSKDVNGANTAGKWTVNLATLADSSISATTYTPGAVNSWIAVSGAAPTKIYTITGTNWAGTTTYYSLDNLGTGKVQINVTNITGAAQSLFTNDSSGAMQVGTALLPSVITGGTAGNAVIWNYSTGPLTVYAVTITGGGGASARCIDNKSTGTCDIYNATITSGSHLSADALRCQVAGKMTLHNCNLVWGSLASPWTTINFPPVLDPKAGNYLQIGSTKFFLPSGVMRRGFR